MAAVGMGTVITHYGLVFRQFHSWLPEANWSGSFGCVVVHEWIFLFIDPLMKTVSAPSRLCRGTERTGA